MIRSSRHFRIRLDSPRRLAPLFGPPRVPDGGDYPVRLHLYADGRLAADARMGPVPIEMDADRFDELVDRALDEIPDEIAAFVENVAVLVEEEPPEDEPDDLLGLYDGVALTERWGTSPMELPDRILIFRGPLLDLCDSEAELVEEVRITVVHEIAHHFGIDDDRLHDLGYA